MKTLLSYFNIVKFSFLLVLSFNAFAEKFENHFLSFQKPPGWECRMLKTEWVCQHENPERKREALIIFAAKIRSDLDSLNSYLTHLKKSKVLKTPSGEKKVSKVMYTKLKKINNQNYVESLHLGSEMSGYYTRYFATVKGDMGIVLTMTVLKTHFAQYNKVFSRVVNSLRVFNKRSDYPKLGKKGKRSILQRSNVESDDSDYNPSINAPDKTLKTQGSSETDSDVWLYILLFIGFCAYLVMKRRNKF